MKKVLSFLTVFLIISSCQAQNEYFRKGQIDAQFGFGFFNTMAVEIDYPIGAIGAFKSPVPSLSLDYGITDAVSIGGFMRFIRSEYASQYYTQDNKMFIIGARATYHFHLLSAFDTYGGAGLGINNRKTVNGGKFQTWDGDGSERVTVNELYYEAFIGGRYKLLENLSAFAEVGYGSAAATIGITLHLQRR